MKKFQYISTTNYLIVFSTILLSFLISSNLAWLNPRPGYEVFKRPHQIPFMWQYNKDSAVEIISGAYFPEAFKIDRYKARINRPTYPCLIFCIGSMIGFLSKPFMDLSPLECSGIAYLILKFIMYCTSALMMFRLIKEYFHEHVAITAIALLMFHSFAIISFSTFHTLELQFATPIISIFLFNDLNKNYSHQKNILYSFCFGLLMLGKQNYAIYLAILALTVLHGNILKAGISVISHLFPLFFWMVFLKLYGLTYYNTEIEIGQGVWILKEFIYQNPIEMFNTICDSIKQYLIIVVNNYVIWIFLSAASFEKVKKVVPRKQSKNVFLFILLCIAANWFQTFVSRRYLPYMSMDIAIFIFTFSAFYLNEIIGNSFIKHKQKILTFIILFWFIIEVFSFIHFPWVHPFDQPSATIKNIYKDLAPDVKR